MYTQNSFQISIRGVANILNSEVSQKCEIAKCYCTHFRITKIRKNIRNLILSVGASHHNQAATMRPTYFIFTSRPPFKDLTTNNSRIFNSHSWRLCLLSIPQWGGKTASHDRHWHKHKWLIISNLCKYMLFCPPLAPPPATPHKQ